MIRVKICGLTRKQDLREAVIAGASYIGLVFFEKSPRNLSRELARELALEAPAGVIKVGLFVNPEDEFLEEKLRDVPLDMIQLHGSETPERVQEIRTRFKLPIMKAIGVSDQNDLEKLKLFEAADQFLLDAKAPKDAALPGGNGVVFDWSLLENLQIDTPWMLAGGLTPENVRQAIEMSRTLQVDVSSGVESEPAIKDKALMEQFIIEARQVK